MPVRKRKSRRGAGFFEWEPYLLFGFDMLNTMHAAGIPNPTREESLAAWKRYRDDCRAKWASDPDKSRPWAELEFEGASKTTP